MRPPHQNRRIGLVILCGGALVIGLVLLLTALGQSTQFFYNPSEIAKPDFESESDIIRVGGLVVDDSVNRSEDLNVKFRLKDFEGSVPGQVSVQFRGVLPDLFKEGKGAVVIGTLDLKGDVVAREVLAKHDENYTPKIAQK